uniref:Chromo domain-containing protein n=1 Tax=Parascaris univalens TaxID=6257 RepID=A0A914ZW92_PARUN
MSANSSGETFEVERIIAVRTEDNGRTLYKVRWLGFSEEDDTWEPYENLTEDCDRLIEVFYKNEMHDQRNSDSEQAIRKSTSTSLTAETAGEEVVGGDDDRASSRSDYETVEVLTPEAWNRFGDLEKREIANLFVENRIPSQTEKVLCAIGYDVGRVTRNKLKAVMKNSSPSSFGKSSPPSTSKARHYGRAKSKRKEGSCAKDRGDVKIEDEEGHLQLGATLVCSGEPTTMRSVAMDDRSTEVIGMADVEILLNNDTPHHLAQIKHLETSERRVTKETALGRGARGRRSSRGKTTPKRGSTRGGARRGKTTRLVVGHPSRMTAREKAPHAASFDSEVVSVSCL